MGYTKEEFLDIISRHIGELAEFEKELRERAKQGELLHEITEAFGEFVKKFSDNEKEAAFTLLFMMGINIAQPKTIFKNIGAARSEKKTKSRGGKN